MPRIEAPERSSKRTEQGWIAPRDVTEERRPRFSTAVRRVSLIDRREAEGTRSCVRAREALYRRMLASGDLVAVSVALLLSVAVVGGHSLRPAALLALPLIVIVCKITRLYDRDDLLLRKTTLDEAPGLLQVATFLTLLAAAAESQLASDTLDRVQLVVLWLSLLTGLLIARAFARLIAASLGTPERCLLIGEASVASQLEAKFELGSVKAKLVARISLDDFAGAGLENGADLEAMLTSLDIDRVIIASGDSVENIVLYAIHTIKAVGARVSVLPRVLEVVGSSVEFDDVNGITMLGVRRFGLTRSSLAIKRGLDLAGSSLGLVALAPLLAAIALAIRLDSRGSIFFRQVRIGRDGRPFEMLKYRTMVEGAEARQGGLQDLNEADGLFKIADDPRITRIGRELRRLSLDELPQLLNVFRGDMSLVGPRPLVIEDDQRVEGVDRSRLHLTPGMTGHWQILGSSRVPLQEMVKIDHLYIANWTLWNDIKILLRTVPYIIARRGL